MTGTPTLPIQRKNKTKDFGFFLFYTSFRFDFFTVPWRVSLAGSLTRLGLTMFQLIGPLFPALHVFKLSRNVAYFVGGESNALPLLYSL